MTEYIVSRFIIIIIDCIAIGLGVVVLHRGIKFILNQLYFLLTLFMLMWVNFAYIARVIGPENIELASSFLRYAWIATPLLFAVLEVFTLKLFRIEKGYRWITLLTFVIAISSSVLIASTDLIIMGIQFSGRNLIINYGSWMVPFLLGITFIMVATIYPIVTRFQSISTSQRERFEFYVLGLTIFYIANLIFNVTLPVFFSTAQYYYFGDYSLIILLGFTAYAIIRKELFDIKLLVVRSVIYTLTTIILGSIFVVSLTLIGQLFITDNNPRHSTIVSAVIAIIVAFLFQPIRSYFDTVSSALFFRDRYVPRKLLDNLSHIMAYRLKLEDITHEVLEEVLKQMRITRGAFILIEKGVIANILHEGYRNSPEYSESDILSLSNTPGHIVFDELEEGETKEILRRLDISIVIPLKTEGYNIGIMVFGEKRSGNLYTDQDINVLDILSRESAVAIHNAQNYERIKRFNITLTEEIKKATEELERANSQLKEADELKDEFVYVASHELRTPMTAIKNYLWLALNKHKGSLDPELEKNLKRAYVSCERLIKLVQDMLTVSRIEGKRLVLNFERIDLLKLYEQIIDEMKVGSEKENIKLILVPTSAPVYVNGDKSRLAEVLQNLLSNAIKFTPANGSVTVSVEQSGDVVVTRVTDTGYGIPTEDIPRLFKKFGRLGHSYKKVAESSGTGLGLFITKQVVEAHNGKISVESVVDQGSTFIFTLPLSAEHSAESAAPALTEQSSV